MTKPDRLELNLEQLNALLDRIEQHRLVETDYPLIADLIRSMSWLSAKLEDKDITIHRLRKIFGFSTERTSNLPGINPEDNPAAKPGSDADKEKGDLKESRVGSDDNLPGGDNPDDNKSRRKGNKFSAKDYKSAIIIKIALFFTGRQHAGENLDNVLDSCPKEMAVPTQMCDASSNNTTDRNQTEEGNCLAHLRRKFFEIAEIWPKYVLPAVSFLNSLFRNERTGKEAELDKAQMFEMHKKKSAPTMDMLMNNPFPVSFFRLNFSKSF
jgi:hypothetical protein